MKIQDILLAILITAVWGFNYIAVKLVVTELPPMMASSLRFLVVLVAFLPFLKLVPGRMAALFRAAFTLGVLHFGAIFLGMNLGAGVGSLSIVSQLHVPFATLLAVIILKERLGWKRTTGIGLSFLGVVVLGFDPEVFNYIDAVIVYIVAAMFYASAAIMMRQLKDVPAVTTQAWVAVMGVFGALVLSMAFEGGQVEAVKNASGTAWLAVLYTGLGSSVIGHGGANYLLTKYEVSEVTPYYLFVPLFAIFGGVVMFGETFTWRMAIGGFLTIVGVVIVTLRNNVRAKSIARQNRPV